MKTLITNIILTMRANSNCANLPEFNITHLDRPNLLGYKADNNGTDDEGNITSSHVLGYYDNGVVSYGCYIKDRSANPGYGGKFYVGAGTSGEHELTGRSYEFESGWSSSAPRINESFNTTYEEISHGKCMDIFTIVGIVKEQYIGKAYLSFNITDSAVDYSINPYDEANVSKFEHQKDGYRDHEFYQELVLDCQDDNFIDDAYDFYNKCREEHGLDLLSPMGVDLSALKWADDNEHEEHIVCIEDAKIKYEAEQLALANVDDDYESHLDDDHSEEAAFYDGRDDWEDEQEYLDWEEGQHEHELFMLTFCGPMLQQDLEEIASGDYCCLLTMQEHNVIPF